jgi:tetratricopeptide (TPR) repeat protein
VEKAIALEPDRPEAYPLLAGLHTGADAARSALVDVERGLEKSPRHLPGWMLKGTLHEKLGEAVEAQKAYRKVLEIDPNHLPALNNLAYNLVENGGDVNEALKFAERAAELAPASAAVNDTLGWVYVQKGVFLKALSHLEPAAERLGDLPAVQYHLGVAYSGAGEKTKALAALSRALDGGGEAPWVPDARATLERLRAQQ